MKEIEMLHRGLATRRHPALLESGELTLARDAEYTPGDVGVSVAYGREKLGQASDPPSPEPIIHAQFLEWDVGAPTREIAYVDPRTPTSLSTVPAKALSNDPAFDSPTTYATLGWGERPMRAVYQGGEWFLLTGGFYQAGVSDYKVNTYLTRRFLATGGSPAIQIHGMPKQTAQTYCYTFGPSGGPIPAGHYNYWFTWANPAYDLEGEFIPDETQLAFTPPVNYVGIFYTASGINVAALRVIASLQEFNSKRPSWATHIKLYRSYGSPTEAYNLSTKNPWWPFGFLVDDPIAISGLATGGTGLDTYYILYDDKFGGGVPADGYSNEDILFQPPYDWITVNGLPFSRRGLPPGASTGTVFEESLVTNDTDNKQDIVYSVEGDPFSFPVPYRLRFDTSSYDEVLRVETVGRTLLVGLRESIWKVNWLPRDTDTGFDKGIVKEQVVGARGLVNAQAATTFDHPDLGPLFVWAARDGVYLTDGDAVIWATKGINWEELVSNVEATIVQNNPDRKRLEVGIQTGPSQVDAWLYITYDEGVRITGPVRRPGGIYATALGVLEDGSQGLLSTDAKGRMYYEGRGITDASSGTGMVMTVQTREIYSAGMSEVFEPTRLFLHADGQGQVGATYEMRGGGSVAQRVIAPDLEDPLATKIKPMRGERMTVLILGSGEGERVNFVGWEWDPQDVQR